MTEDELAIWYASPDLWPDRQLRMLRAAFLVDRAFVQTDDARVFIDRRLRVIESELARRGALTEERSEG